MKFGSQYVKELSFCTGIAYIFYMAGRTQRISGEEGSPAPRLRRRSRPGTFLAFFLLAVLAVSAFQVASKFPDLSDPILRTSSSTVSVHSEGGDLRFLPQGREALPVGFIMYPGAKVPKEAYSYLARSLAEEGYPAVLVDAPLGFAIFGVDAASPSIAALTGVKRWVLAGHSLGGVAASLYAKKHPESVAGIVLLGSYPPGGGSLAGLDLRALSISASNDMLATQEKIEKSRTLLLETTLYLRVPGGNHAQFGEYGSQRGDGAAEIPPGRQQGIVVESVLALMANLR